jgi:hypothetical protein
MNNSDLKMTEEQKTLLEQIAKELNGELTHYICCDLYSTHQKIEITYDAKSKR